MAGRFGAAAASEALRAAQKDRFYRQELMEDIRQACIMLLGSRCTEVWQPELQAVSTLAYLGLTTGRRRQTLGEEYCDLTRVHWDSGRMPSRRQRWACVLVHALLPYAFSKLCRRLLARLRQTDAADSWLLHALVPRLMDLRDASETFHSALFCLGSPFVHFADRLARLSTVRHSAFPRPQGIHKLIGALLMFQLALATANAALRLYNARAARRRLEIATTPPCHEAALENESIDAQQSRARVCSLCLSPRRYPTAGVCGHIFCWDCVHEWVADKTECPLCRTALTPQSLRCLHRYL